ncbi:Uncharacterised protein [Chlamydia abortus]|uniref:Acetyl-CoA acetyltransferase n=1 Tax=Paenibacillus residui TaxID=629724 RepID=A0ABW3DCN7_9BACL|nr:hypothetical protein [Paenibacillus sp. 32O-W]SHE15364.1 Uncharacterised protein [Chlamydia abortus]
MMNVELVSRQTVYQADAERVETIKSIRSKVRMICGQCMQRPVRVEMIDGHVYEGTIVHMDNGHLYLSVPQYPSMQRSFWNPYYNAYAYNNVILPLVLYELLVITLLS